MRHGDQTQRPTDGQRSTLPPDLSIACKLLGPEEKKLLCRGSNCEFDDLARSLVLQDDLFRLRFPHQDSNGESIIVTMTMMGSAQDRFHYNCTLSGSRCEHIAAAFALVLEEKLLLGLAEAPPERALDEPRGRRIELLCEVRNLGNRIAVVQTFARIRSVLANTS